MAQWYLLVETRVGTGEQIDLVIYDRTNTKTTGIVFDTHHMGRGTSIPLGVRNKAQDKEFMSDIAGLIARLYFFSNKIFITL